MRASIALPLVVLALGAAGCADDVDDRPAQWSYISAAIIQPSCTTAGCHSHLTSAGGIQLDTPEAGYTFLVGGGFVIPEQPDQSKLLRLLRGDEVWTMPPDTPLPEADIRLIERWIEEGAGDN
jgi:hypothetical protein